MLEQSFGFQIFKFEIWMRIECRNTLQFKHLSKSSEKNQALSQIHQDQFNHIVSNTRWERRAWNLTQGFRMMASTWSLALWLTATDHHSTGPDVFTPLSAAGAAESRGALQSTGPYRDKQRSRMRAPHQRHVSHSSITRSSRVHWLHCFRNCRMDSNRGVDFIVLPAGKSGDGKLESRNPQAWGLKRGEVALFTVRIDFTCLYLWIWMELLLASKQEPSDSIRMRWMETILQ